MYLGSCYKWYGDEVEPNFKDEPEMGHCYMKKTGRGKGGRGGKNNMDFDGHSVNWGDETKLVITEEDGEPKIHLFLEGSSKLMASSMVAAGLVLLA